jgi:hypothetical protein
VYQGVQTPASFSCNRKAIPAKSTRQKSIAWKLASAVLSNHLFRRSPVCVLQHGFGMIEKLGGIRAIQSHVATLTEYLYERMANLRHSNGKPMLQVFGKHHFANSRQVSSRDCMQGLWGRTLACVVSPGGWLELQLL